MLLDGQRFRIDVVEFQCTRCRIPQCGEDDGTSGRTPEDAIALLPLQRFDRVHFRNNLLLLACLLTLLLLAFQGLEHIIECNIDLGTRWVLRMYDSKPTPMGLPRKAHHGILHIQHLHGNPRLVHPKQFKVIVQRLFRLGMSRDLDSQVFSPLLPDHAALSDIEEILLTELFTRWDGDEIDVCRLILVLWGPVRDNVCCGAE
mmetsp:Transcript_34452/g.61925  ORF Transcript_34452/g.61925 Transcript_34452/m.61925 type:complete len:202 (-) Transcript_34452:1096-1701(-)